MENSAKLILASQDRLEKLVGHVSIEQSNLKELVSDLLENQKSMEVEFKRLSFQQEYEEISFLNVDKFYFSLQYTVFISC